MSHPNLVALGLKSADQILGGGYRPVSAAGAAEGNSQIGPSLLNVVREREPEEIPELLQIRSGCGIVQEELRHSRILPAQGAQLPLKMGIGETAEIDHKIGIGRDTMPIPERNNSDRRFAA